MRGLLAFLLFASVWLTTVAAIGQGTSVKKEHQPVVVKVGVNSDGETNHAQIVYFKGGMIHFLTEMGEGYVDTTVPGFTVWCGPPGSYLMVANGNLSIVQIQGDPSDPDDPGDPDPPDPPDPPSTIAETVAELTKDQNNKSALAKVFDKHSGIFGTTEGNTAELFADWTLDMQRTIGAGNEYGGLRSWMTEYVQENWPMSNDAVSVFFAEVAKGLRL